MFTACCITLGLYAGCRREDALLLSWQRWGIVSLKGVVEKLYYKTPISWLKYCKWAKAPGAFRMAHLRTRVKSDPVFSVRWQLSQNLPEASVLWLSEVPCFKTIHLTIRFHLCSNTELFEMLYLPIRGVLGCNGVLLSGTSNVILFKCVSCEAGILDPFGLDNRKGYTRSSWTMKRPQGDDVTL